MKEDDGKGRRGGEKMVRNDALNVEIEEERGGR